MTFLTKIIELVVVSKMMKDMLEINKEIMHIQRNVITKIQWITNQCFLEHVNKKTHMKKCAKMIGTGLNLNILRTWENGSSI